MSCMSQNFRLFLASNLSVQNFRIFLLMYPGSVSGSAAGLGRIRPRSPAERGSGTRRPRWRLTFT